MTSKHRIVLVALGSVISLAILWPIASTLPLTHDEAFTFIRLADSSPWAIIHDYSMTWTNQVPFSILQSMVPNSWIATSLTVIRLPSVLVSVLLIIVTLDLLSWGRRSMTLFLMLLAASPLAITYLVLSRGYSLVMLLVAASIWIIRRAHLRESLSWWSIAAGALLVATAAWAVPTAVYLGPGLALALWLRFSLARAAVFLSLTAIGSLAVHLSHLQEMISQAKNNPWSGPIAIRPLLQDSLFVWWVPITALIVLLLCSIGLHLRRASSIPIKTFRVFVRDHFVLSTCYLVAVGYFSLTLSAALIGLGWPFSRNALPAIWCLFIGLALTLRLDRLIQILVVGAIAVSSVFGIFATTKGLLTNDFSLYGPSMIDAVPNNLANLRQFKTTHVYCSGYDAPVCLMATEFLANQGIGVIISGGLLEDIQCAVGSLAPRPPWQVRAMQGDTLLGQVCH